MNLLKRVHRVLSSLGLGVVLIALIALILAVATKFESNTSTHLVQVYIYRTGWFDFLLALFGLNLTLATWNLRPFKLRHIGVLTIHSSLLIILVGAWMTRNIGFEGTMVIEEGEEADFITLREMVVTVYDKDRMDQPLRVFDTWYHNSPPREFLNDRFEIDPGQQLTVDRYYTDAQPVVEVRDEGPKEDPALHFQFSSSMFQQDGWLFPRRPTERRRDFGGLLQFESAEYDALDEWMSSLQVAGPGSMDCSFRGKREEIQLPAAGDTLALPGGYKLLLLRFYRNFSMGQENEYQDLPGEASNPALQFQILRGDTADDYLYFQKMPDFDPLLGVTAEHPILSGIDWSPMFHENDLGEKQVRLALVGGDLRSAWLFEGALQEQSMELGEAVTLPWMGFQLAIDRVYRRAWRAEDMENVDVKSSNPAIRIRSGEGDMVEQKWLRLGQRKQMSIGGQDYVIGFEQQRIPLGFSLLLDDFIEDRYPGSMMASGYASFVKLNDESTGKRGEAIEISMNNTLVHGGFKFFQSSFRRASHPGGKETTILSVNHDPGHLVVYLGSLTLVLGLMVVFFFKRKLIQLERRSA